MDTYDFNHQELLAQSNSHGLVAHAIIYHLKLSTLWHFFGCGDVELTLHERACATGRQAAEKIKSLQASNVGYIFRIVRYPMPQDAADLIISQQTWAAREQARFDDGTYILLPWANEPWFKDKHEELKHFAHVSREDDTMIAFTPDNTFGVENRKLRVSASAYLSRNFQSQLDCLPPVITERLKADQKTHVIISPLAHYSRLFNKAYGQEHEVLFASTEDEMEEVYTNGPGSCMSKDVSEYQTDGIHPCRVYAAGDLKLAYVKNGSRITARALVWPDKMVTGRIYGDVDLLESGLKELGYETAQDNHGRLAGARLLKIPCGDGYVMPYIDGDSYYHNHPIDTSCFAIGKGADRNGCHEASSQNGLDHEPEDENSFCCDRCNVSNHTDDSYTVYENTRNGSEQMWCNRCYENHAFYCAETERTYSDSVAYIVLATGECVATYNLGNYFQCTVDGEWHHNDDMAGTFMNDSDAVSESAVADENLQLCDADGFYYHIDDMPEQTEPELNEVAA